MFAELPHRFVGIHVIEYSIRPVFLTTNWVPVLSIGKESYHTSNFIHPMFTTYGAVFRTYP